MKISKCPIGIAHALVLLDGGPITQDLDDTHLPLEVKCMFCGEEFQMKEELVLEHGAALPNTLPARTQGVPGV